MSDLDGLYVTFNGRENVAVPEKYTRMARRMLSDVARMSADGVLVNGLNRQMPDGAQIRVLRVLQGYTGVAINKVIITAPEHPVEAPAGTGDPRQGFIWIGAKVLGGGDGYYVGDNADNWFDEDEKDRVRPKLYLYVWEPPYDDIGKLSPSGNPTNDLLFLRDSIGRVVFWFKPPTALGLKTNPKEEIGLGTIPGDAYPDPPGSQEEFNAQYGGAYGSFLTREIAYQTWRAVNEILKPTTAIIRPHYRERTDPRDDPALYPCRRLNKNSYGITYTRNGFYMMEVKDHCLELVPILATGLNNVPRTTESDGPAWVKQFDSLKDWLAPVDEADNTWDTVAVLNPYRGGAVDLMRSDVDPLDYAPGYDEAVEKAAAKGVYFTDESDGMEDDRELTGTVIDGIYAVRLGVWSWYDPNGPGTWRKDARFTPINAKLRIRSGVGEFATVDDYELTIVGRAHVRWYTAIPDRGNQYPDFPDLTPGGWYACWNDYTATYDPVTAQMRDYPRPYPLASMGGLIWGRWAFIDSVFTVSDTPFYGALHATDYKITYYGDVTYLQDSKDYIPPIPDGIGAVNYTAANLWVKDPEAGPLFAPYDYFVYPSVFRDDPAWMRGYGGCDDGPWWSPTFFVDPTGGSWQDDGNSALPWGIQPEFSKSPRIDYANFF